MTESRSSLDTFGKFLMENLRDPAITYYDNLVEEHWKGRGSTQLQTDLKTLNEQQRSIVRRCVIKAIDVGMHDLLFRLHELAHIENNIQILVNGENIVELSDGLYGEIFSEEGWGAKYSKFGEPSEVA